MAHTLASGLVLVFCLVFSASAFKTTISLCLCTGEQPGTNCRLIDGTLTETHIFTYTNGNTEEYKVPLAHLTTYQSVLCTGVTAKRQAHFEIGHNHLDVGVKAGPVDFGVTGSVGKDGVSGTVHGDVHFGAVDVEGHAGIDPHGTVSGGGHVAVGLGHYANVDIHGEANSKGEHSAGVGGHLDFGPIHGSTSTDIDQNGHISTHNSLDIFGKRRAARNKRKRMGINAIRKHM